MARVIAITNLKGGVGKSLTAINLSAGIAREGVATLLVDVDLRGRLAAWLNHTPRLTLGHVIAGQTDVDQAIVQIRPQFDLLASGSGALQGYVQRLEPARVNNLLHHALAPIMDRYHVIIFDCGPSGDVFSNAGYAAADEAVIVATTDQAGADGLDEAVDHIKRMQRLGFPVRITAVVPTMYDAGTRECRAWLSLYREQIAILTDPIRTDIRLREQPRIKQPIFEFAPKSAGAEDYGRLVRRILYGP